jgi:N-acetylneuraminic acid mutarotase
MPKRLRELYVALGNDPFLVEECLARPALVDRLARSFFRSDSRIHGAAKKSAEDLRAELERRGIGAFSTDPRRTDFGIVRRESRDKRDRSPEAFRGKEGERALEPEEFLRWRARLPERVGEIGPIIDSGSTFDILALIEEKPGLSFRVARFSIAKGTWDDWLSEASRDLDHRLVEPVGAGTDPLPRIRLAPTSSEAGGHPTDSCSGDGTWDNGSLDDVPENRQNHTSVWTGSVMLVWGGEDGGYLNTGGAYDPVTDSWVPMSTIGAPAARSYHAAVWTGDRMVVWGGYNGTFLDSGGRYDPATDTWVSTSRTAAPTVRRSHTAVWTGNRMVVWGGDDGTYLGSGGRYDPVSDTWASVTSVGAPAGRWDHTAVWTGSRMVVWGGYNGSFLNTGGRYDPIADAWTPTSTTGAPDGRRLHVAVWTGSRMIVWGGLSCCYLGTGGRYDPATDTWSATTTGSVPLGSEHSAAVWTGSVMIVWGGYAGGYLNEGGLYDPVVDRWTRTSIVGAPRGRSRHTAVWTGVSVVIWGGYSNGSPVNTGGRYDPETDGWTPTSLAGAPTARTHHSAVWTGNVMVIWAGGDVDDFSGYSTTGGRYDPTLDSWSPVSTVNAPGPRWWNTALWTGHFMVVWGGYYGPYLNTGGRYDPVADTWTATSLVGAPFGRYGHAAAWTGRQMIVWGGYGGSYWNNGGRYDPESDTWSSLSTAGAPAARFFPTAVWTGSVFVVWGGDNDVQSLNTGGRYDPATNSWTPTSTAGAPSARGGHSGVWSGSRMIIWGGWETVHPLNTGGSYDPTSDSWTPTSIVGAPAGHMSHTAVWTGESMIVWGGLEEGFVASDTGGRYDPVTDAWVPTSSVFAPSKRTYHTAVWADGEMLVWGGSDAYEHSASNTGGRYFVCSTNETPVAVAGADTLVECSGDSSATIRLDGTASSDPDSTPGTNDDIVDFAWTEKDRDLGHGAQIDWSFGVGEHAVLLTVTDRAGATSSDEVIVTVQDSLAPTGGISFPHGGECFGPSSLPVVVADSLSDTCDPDLARGYEPVGGPAYSGHGDYDVTLTATDVGGNAASDTVAFTIDTVPPIVKLVGGTGGSPLSTRIPFTVALLSSDDDGASGDVVHEVVKLNGCVAFDGLTYGDQDGLLSDEVMRLTNAELCRIFTACGFRGLLDAEVRAEATDCGGNVGSAVEIVPGKLRVKSGTCDR